ncbi:MAG: hypothetical protein WAK95_05930 [Desulfobacterales bacterium]
MLGFYSSILSISPVGRPAHTKKQSLNFSFFYHFSLIFIKSALRNTLPRPGGIDPAASLVFMAFSDKVFGLTMGGRRLSRHTPMTDTTAKIIILTSAV